MNQSQNPNATVSGEFHHRAGERVGVYVLEKPLGAGGFAEVWKATETTANRSVALKIFFDHVMVMPSQAAIFRKEAQKQARLESERVTPIYYCHLDASNGPGPYYIAMKLMPGGTLDGLLRRENRLPVPKALAIVRDILEGLSVAHDAGIIHRDIKPKNVLLDNRQRAYLADFGIAKDLGADTHTRIGTVMGTAEYMSLEQSMGQPVTKASDIYSVGVVLYEMLVGQPPFTGPTETAIMIARKEKEPPPPHLEVPGIPRRLEIVVLRCLDNNPVDRYEDCPTLLRALDWAMEPTSTRTEPEPPKPQPEPPRPGLTPIPDPPPASSGRGRIYGAAAAGIILLAGGGLWFSSHQQLEERKAEKPRVLVDRTQVNVVDWTRVNYDDPRLKSCESDDQGCHARVQYVQKVESVNFKTVAKNDPIRRDCAGWRPCLSDFPSEGTTSTDPGPPPVRSQRTCTQQTAEIDLPAECPANDKFCISCKEKWHVTDGIGIGRNNR